jgi:hypothetical protein
MNVQAAFPQQRGEPRHAAACGRIDYFSLVKTG